MPRARGQKRKRPRGVSSGRRPSKFRVCVKGSRVVYDIVWSFLFAIATCQSRQSTTAFIVANRA